MIKLTPTISERRRLERERDAARRTFRGALFSVLGTVLLGLILWVALTLSFYGSLL